MRIQQCHARVQREFVGSVINANIGVHVAHLGSGGGFIAPDAFLSATTCLQQSTRNITQWDSFLLTLLW